MALSTKVKEGWLGPGRRPAPPYKRSLPSSLSRVRKLETLWRMNVMKSVTKGMLSALS